MCVKIGRNTCQTWGSYSTDSVVLLDCDAL
jgi:hypothetical protein